MAALTGIESDPWRTIRVQLGLSTFVFGPVHSVTRFFEARQKPDVLPCRHGEFEEGRCSGCILLISPRHFLDAGVDGEMGISRQESVADSQMHGIGPDSPTARQA